MTSRLMINYIMAPQAPGTRALTGVSAVIGPIWCKNTFQMAEIGINLYVKTPPFQLDLHFPEHENDIPPDGKLHQGPQGTWYEFADGGFSGYRPIWRENIFQLAENGSTGMH